METKFQTSFIPRKPMTGSQPSMTPPALRRIPIAGGSIFVTLATVIFVISVLSIGGAFLWKVFLQRQQVDLQQQLAQKSKDFNLDQIQLMKAESTKISLARQLLTNHMSSSKIFSVMSAFTTQSVRFLNLEMTVPAGTPQPMQLSLTGYGRNFNAIAFQSDVLNDLGKYGNLRTVVRNPIISNPVLNANGTVAFGFTAQVDPSSFSYAKSLTPDVQNGAQGDTSDTSQQ